MKPSQVFIVLRDLPSLKNYKYIPFKITEVHALFLCVEGVLLGTTSIRDYKRPSRDHI